MAGDMRDVPEADMAGDEQVLAGSRGKAATGDVGEEAKEPHVPVIPDHSITDNFAPTGTGPLMNLPAPAPFSIPTPAVPNATHCSTRTIKISKTLLESLESQSHEAAVKAAGEDWATSCKTPRNMMRAAVALNIPTPGVPQSYQEAMMHPKVWMGPMEKEYASLVGREVWTLVDRPPGANVIDSKWVYTVKYNAQGVVIKWKARLVAKGFQQIAGVDFFEMYTGIVRYESLRMLWAVCVNEPGWVMWRWTLSART